VDYGFGSSATEAGLLLLPSSVAMLFAGPIAGLLGRRFGSKLPLTIGMLLVATASTALAGWHDTKLHVLGAMLVLGVGVAFAFAAMVALIAEAVRPTETGVATGMNTVMRTVGGVIGGQVGAALLTANTIGSTGVPAEHGFTVAFTLSAVAALAAAVVAVFITSPFPPRRRLSAAGVAE
jgi:MFS family permease